MANKIKEREVLFMIYLDELRYDKMGEIQKYTFHMYDDDIIDQYVEKYGANHILGMLKAFATKIMESHAFYHEGDPFPVGKFRAKITKEMITPSEPDAEYIASQSDDVTVYDPNRRWDLTPGSRESYEIAKARSLKK